MYQATSLKHVQGAAAATGSAEITALALAPKARLLAFGCANGELSILDLSQVAFLPFMAQAAMPHVQGPCQGSMSHLFVKAQLQGGASPGTACTQPSRPLHGSCIPAHLQDLGVHPLLEDFGPWLLKRTTISSISTAQPNTAPCLTHSVCCVLQPAVLVRRWAYKGPLHQLHYILSGAYTHASPADRQAACSSMAVTGFEAVWLTMHSTFACPHP